MKGINFILTVLMALIIISCQKEEVDYFDSLSGKKDLKEINLTTEVTVDGYDFTITTTEEEFLTLCPEVSTTSLEANLFWRSAYFNRFNQPDDVTFFGGWVSGDVFVVIYDYYNNILNWSSYSSEEPFFIGVASADQIDVIFYAEDGISFYFLTEYRGFREFCDAPISTVDLDGDGILDEDDNCPNIINPDQEDYDSDGEGDVCDTDDDNDQIQDILDNCPLTPNYDQKNYDNDNMGDVCDSDDDNDGVVDLEDYVQFSNTENSITINNCDSGVVNQQLNNGVFMSDLIDEIEMGEYKNLGQTIRSYNDLMNKWINDGVITGEEKTLILNCAIVENQ